jgi:hypothetical protein
MARRSWERYKSYTGRRVGVLEPRQRFLIVCEGKKTEPNYFEKFPVPKDVIVKIHRGAGVHISVVREAIMRRDESEEEYDQIWCVFDRDKQPGHPRNTQNFNEALRLAADENIQVAYSNDAFELWYLLHFDYHDTAIHRHDYCTKLQSKVAGGYRKNDDDIYEKLADKMDAGCRNAARLLAQYVPSNPEADDPSTTVHLLVNELRKYVV